MNRDSAAPRPFTYLAITLNVLGALLFAVGWAAFPVRPTVYLALMIIAAVLSEHYAPTIGGHSASISMPLAIAAMTLGGPCAAVLVASLSAIRSDSLASRRLFVVTAFNFGQYAVILGCASLAYTSMGGPILTSEHARHLVSADFPAALLPMAAAILVAALGNMFITGVGVAALYGMSPGDALAGVLPHGPSLIALGLVGYLIAQVVASNAIALPLFLFPLMLARQIYQRYATMKDAYLDTVGSLVSALEAKDPYTRGHSVRVAEYAVRIGRKLGHDERTIDMLEKSALLHDIGKLALSSSMLIKPSKLTDAEFAEMKRHPLIGADMLHRIPPLRGLTLPVQHHHERFGGGGYPDGIRDHEIHPLAKILAVADAFDAMTTNRAYRPAMSPADAVVELYQGMGSQFDPTLVEVFVETLHDVDGLLEPLTIRHVNPAIVPSQVGAS